MTRDEERRLEIAELFGELASGATTEFLSDGYRFSRQRAFRPVIDRTGLCIRCRRVPPTRAGVKSCDSCLRYVAAYNAGPGREGNLRRMRKYDTKKRALVRAKGYCATCRLVPARPDRVSCVACTEKQRARYLRKRGGQVSRRVELEGDSQ